jgi:hypothetical protein
MFKLDIDIQATTWDELEFALEEVKKKVSESYSGGNDEREDGITNYQFAVTGEESPYIVCPHCQTNVYYEGDKPSICDNCRGVL